MEVKSLLKLKTITRLCLYFFFTALLFFAVFIPEILYGYFLVEFANIWVWIASGVVLPVLYLISCLVFGLVHSKVICNLFLPKIKPGKYSHDSDEAKLYGVRVVSPGIYKSMLKAFSFVPHLYSMLIGQALRLYGLKCGKNVYMSAGTMIDSHLVEIGENSFIGLRAIISAHVTENRVLILSPVKIGKNVTIGGNCIIACGAEVGDNVIIGVNSYVKKGQKLKANCVYAGNPVRLIREL